MVHNLYIRYSDFRLGKYRVKLEAFISHRRVKSNSRNYKQMKSKGLLLVNATQQLLKRGVMTKLKGQTTKIDSEFHECSHITKHGTNIFIDLGFPEKVVA